MFVGFFLSGVVNLWLPWEIYRRGTCSVRREDMKPSVPTNRWGESGGNRKGIFLRDMQYKKPKALYIFFCQHSTWRNLTWTLEFSTKTRSWISVFLSKYEKEKCILCQTARSRYLSTILVVVVRKTNTRRIAGEEGFRVKKENKGFNKGFPAKGEKQRFRQSLSQS